MATDHIRLFNIGLGRDSITALLLLAERKLRWREELVEPSSIDGVVFSDPGEEWDHTYRTIPIVQKICDAISVPFFNLKKPRTDVWKSNPREMGDRTDPAWVAAGEGMGPQWKAESGAYHRRIPIIDEYMRFKKITARVSASCTLNHKVLPIRRLLWDLTMLKFGKSNTTQWGRMVQKGLVPKHWVIIGIAADEARRAIDTGRPLYEHPAYPLVEMGIAKDDEEEILKHHDLNWVAKSGCIACHFQPVGWYALLRETEPGRYKKIVQYEALALSENPKMFLQGRQRIDEMVDAWRARHPHVTHDEIRTKSYQRGGRFGGDPRQCSLPFAMQEEEKMNE